MKRARNTFSVMQLGGLALVAAAAAVAFLPGHAFGAGPAVTTSPASGPFTDGQSITVSGTGFPNHAQDPSGLSILECSDPGGTTANLPTDATACDGTTVNGLAINTNASGSFGPAQYSIVALSIASPGSSNINCDATNYCVLWVGVDYNNAFTQNFAFSEPFTIGSSSTTTTTTTIPTTTTTIPTTTTTTIPGTTTTTTTTTIPGTTTTTAVSGSTTTTSSTTSTTDGGSTTTTSSTSTLPPTNAAGGTGSSSDGATAANSGGSPSSSSGSTLAFTGVPPVLPWLVVLGLLMLVVGSLGRRLVPPIPQ